MNIHEAIDRLEYLIAHSRQIPLTRTVVVDHDEAIGLIDELRLSLPDEIKQARWTLQEQQRLIADSQSEASRILHQASDRAQTMMGQHELMKRAEKQGEAIVRDAAAKADEIRRAADSYAWEVMQQLETQLLRTVATVKKGVDSMRKPTRPEIQTVARR
jgi:vacuolar-type H+-ATPase subunit H